MGKRKVISEKEIQDIVLPVANDALSIATRLLGFGRVLVKCQDGHERLCRIRGEMKRRVWIRIGDVGLVSPWNFQSHKRSGVIWRHKKSQAERLRKNEHLSVK
ncbi:MAG: translation initiation factor 1A [Candidatus Bathyarchaeota archaeon]|nr:MAG: translation initiation factor 1A [Candidatus Bathyarchaeota archaeon]